jgi:ATP-dependent RNA helicase RhlE
MEYKSNAVKSSYSSNSNSSGTGRSFKSKPRGTGYGARTSFSSNSRSENRGGASSGGGYKSSGFKGNGGNRGGGNGNRGGGRRYSAQRINHSMYISKAVEGYEAPSIFIDTYKFSDLDLNAQLQKNILQKGYTYPTKIQDLTVKSIMDGHDVLGVASTGSGKTAAFLIPLINKAVKNLNEKCLIIVPTRELAKQIREEFVALTFGMNVRSVDVIGGESMSKQVYLLKKQPQFVIGTPGRLKDLEERRMLRLDDFNNIVLDEVDRMLDMGFVDDVKFLTSKLRSEKQSLFFSATMSVEAEKVAALLLKNPVKFQAEKVSPAHNVDQDVVRVSNMSLKMEKLHELLIKEEFKKVLIFSRTKRGADSVSKELEVRGFKVDSIHGDKSQYKRTRVISNFKFNKFNILVATDVASRGIDIKDVSHVINYDEPETYDDYIHRIGRTGRVGKKGIALTFVKG